MQNYLGEQELMTCKRTRIFSYQRLHRFPRFEVEARDNSKMAHNELNTQDTKIDGTVPGNASLVYWVLFWFN